MKKNMLIIRLGTPLPLPKEVKLMNEKIVHPEDMEAGLAFGWDLCGMGIVSLVRTHLGAAEITRLYQELADSTGDFLPVVVQDLDEGGCGLSSVKGFNQMVSDYRALLQEPVPQQQQQSNCHQVEMNLDELLDLANRKGGVSKLSADELQLLEKLSKNL
jgi:hypothetical protein